MGGMVVRVRGGGGGEDGSIAFGKAVVIKHSEVQQSWCTKHASSHARSTDQGAQDFNGHGACGVRRLDEDGSEVLPPEARRHALGVLGVPMCVSGAWGRGEAREQARSPRTAVVEVCTVTVSKRREVSELVVARVTALGTFSLDLLH